MLVPVRCDALVADDNLSHRGPRPGDPEGSVPRDPRTRAREGEG